jgi:hypothetical protein
VIDEDMNAAQAQLLKGLTLADSDYMQTSIEGSFCSPCINTPTFARFGGAERKAAVYGPACSESEGKQPPLSHLFAIAQDARHHSEGMFVCGL